MKLLAVNGSPRKKGGNTAVVLDSFLGGAMDAGAETETLYTADLVIKPCRSYMTCWTKTPGVCAIEDDMKDVIVKIHDADTVVLAAPVYVDSFPGPMKTMLDRMILTLQPFFEVRGGRTRHPLRDGFGKKKLVLISVCGLYEMENFDVIVDHFKAFCANFDAEVSGILLRPHGGGLTFLKEKGRLDLVLGAFATAGRELVATGGISDATGDSVSKPLFTKEQYIEIINTSFQKALDRL